MCIIFNKECLSIIFIEKIILTVIYLNHAVHAVVIH